MGRGEQVYDQQLAVYITRVIIQGNIHLLEVVKRSCVYLDTFVIGEGDAVVTVAACKGGEDVVRNGAVVQPLDGAHLVLGFHFRPQIKHAVSRLHKSCHFRC